MSTLVDLVKLGAIGASLAFLLLAYRLLKSATSLKDTSGNPVPPAAGTLNAIKGFRRSALIFLIVGLIAEFVSSHGTQVLSIVEQLLFKKEMVRVRFNEWEFLPEENIIAFSFEENRVDLKRYVLPASKDSYDVYVGVRQQDDTPAERGQYKLVFGPYQIATLSRFERKLSSSELEILGRECIVFTAFGIERSNSKPVELTSSFDLTNRSEGVAVFNHATACVTQSGAKIR